MEELRFLSQEELERLFEARKRALIAVRDELDRRAGDPEGVDFDFCQYVNERDEE